MPSLSPVELRDELERLSIYNEIYLGRPTARERGALSHDDRLDALAIAVNYWVESMARDADRAVGERQEDLIRDELERLWASIDAGDSVCCDTSAYENMESGQICNISQHNSYNLLN